MNRRLLVAAQLVFAALVLWFVHRQMAPIWDDVRASAATVELRWLPLAVASLLVLLTHAVLIETWRRVLAAWSAPLAFVDAARVWTVSNLARFLPGPVWQIGAMSALARREGASAVAATGSSLLIAIVNVTVGFAVVFATGARALDVVRDGGRAAGVLAAVIALGVVLAVPIVVPRLAALAARVTRRPVSVGAVPPRVIWFTVVGTGLQWLAYGLAFRLFAQALLGDRATGAVLPYVAVYTSAYLLGYINPFAPGGLIVRETALQVGMTAFGLASSADAALVAIASRLWLTLLEVTPGLVFLGASAASRPPQLRNDVPTE